MRYLIVVPSLARAGAETQAISLANGLSAKGHDIHLCTFEANLDQRDRVSNNVRFHHVTRTSKYNLAFTGPIAEIIDREKIQVVQGVLMFGALVAWVSSRRSRFRPHVVAAIHTTITRGLKAELQNRLLYRRILKRLPAILFVCEYQRDYWLQKYPELESRAHVVYNGIDTQRFRRTDFEWDALRLRRSLSIPDTAIVFACVARFRPEKGHKILIEAFSRLPRDAYLMLAGDGETRPRVEAAVRYAGLGDRVLFLGNVADVRPLIAASDATVLASTAVETFSIAMLESMALEVPMIAPRIGGLPEAIRHGETGLLFPIGDVQALADCMAQVSKDTSQARTMGQAAAARVRNSFTLDQMIIGNERVLNSVA